MNQTLNHENGLKEKVENPDFFIQQFFLGCLAEFSYYIESKGEVAILDPLRQIDQYLELAKERGAKIKYILETHLHADFVSGHVDLAKATGATIVYGPTAQTGFPIKQATDGELLPLGSVQIRVDHTPGHTMESSCFVLIQNGKPYCTFTGDTLFLGEVGRPDLAVKSGEVTVEMLAGLLYDSLRNKVMTLADDVIVYPGHGSGSSCGKAIGAGNSCTMGKQKQNNYALKEMTKEAFTVAVLENMPKPPQYFFHDAKMNKNGPADVNTLIEKVQKALTYDQFTELVKGGALVVDSRANISEGVIEGAMNITFSANFATFVGTLIKPDTKIVIVADAGSAQESILRLLRIGYDNIQGYLQGGFEVYKNHGGAIAQITISNLVDFLDTKGKPEEHIILDVRNPGEWKEGICPGATTIALGELEANLNKLPKDKTIHVYCKTGGRAKMGMSILRRNGFKHLVITQEGGFEQIVKANGLQAQIP